MCPSLSGPSSNVTPTQAEREALRFERIWQALAEFSQVAPQYARAPRELTLQAELALRECDFSPKLKS
jgi:hypothetical protein